MIYSRHTQHSIWLLQWNSLQQFYSTFSSNSNNYISQGLGGEASFTVFEIILRVNNVSELSEKQKAGRCKLVPPISF
jgi:hypothetical protein